MIEYKNKLIKAIEYHFPHAKIYLFGSWATGKNKHNSDIDLAIDNNQPIDFYDLDSLEQTILNLDIPNEVDVVDLQNIDSDFKHKIEKEMILWKE